MLDTIKRFTVIEMILTLRAISIAVQISLLLFVNLVLGYALPWIPMFIIIGVAALFNVFCFCFYQVTRSGSKTHILWQLLADVGFLGCLLYFSGGATNAFVSLLLIPIAISAVSLSFYQMIWVAFVAILTYSLLLWAMPMHVMHGNMEGHFIGMWLNFLFTAVVVTLVVGQLAQLIRIKQTTIAQFREEQLKQERIMALGVAAAQVTHDLATPLATITLLVDEFKEQQAYDEQLVETLSKQVKRCNQNLHCFRDTVAQIKSNSRYQLSSEKLLKQLKHHCYLTYPDMMFTFEQQHAAVILAADGALLPAIANIIDNAVQASQSNKQTCIRLTACVKQQQWQLIIRDFGAGFLAQQNKLLGTMPMSSESGLGISVLLSNASLERLSGKLELTNYEQGAQVTISLPINLDPQVAHLNIS